jgi:DNA-binding IclR family transcriptional regulator
LHRLNATRAVHHLVQEGESLPLTVGAAGHVLRAFSGVRGQKFDEVRRSMFAASFGERERETAAVASPVFGFNNALVGALSVSGPRYRIEDVGVGQILPVLFKYAKQLTKSMGGNIDAPELSGWRATRSEAVVRPRPVRRPAN